MITYYCYWYVSIYKLNKKRSEKKKNKEENGKKEVNW